MAKSDWRFQSEFEKLRLRAGRYGVDHSSVMTNELPLIRWEGSTEAVKRLGDPQQQPPEDIDNPYRARCGEEFLCWLMLPKSFSSKVWYFGRVFSTRKSKPDELRMFQDIAAEAGSLLRQDKLFRGYLAPCVKHSELAARFSQFQTNLDVTTWCALLFAHPEFKHPIKFPYKKSKLVGETIAEASIVNPFVRTAEVIKHWRLNSATPMPATGRVAQPYKWPMPKAIPSVKDSANTSERRKARCETPSTTDAKPSVKLGPHPQITIGKKAIALEHDHAVYLKTLIGANDWMSDGEFRKRHPELGDNARPDRWRKKLPTEVAKRIETTSRGSRWRGKPLP